MKLIIFLFCLFGDIIINILEYYLHILSFIF